MSSAQGRNNPTEPSAEAGAGPDTTVPESEQELRQEIEQTREQLGDTVQLLVAKTDVKGRARAKVAGLTDRVKGKAAGRGADVRSQVAGKATIARQKATARRDQLQARATGAWQTAPEGVRHSVAKGASTARQRWMPLLAALLALGSAASGYLAFRGRNRR